MPVLEARSTLTAKGQTTVPKMVRKVLRIEVGDEITFRVEGDRVMLVPTEALHEDPLVGSFLDFLAKDMKQRPQAIKPLSRDFASRMSKLIKGKQVDLEAPIEGAVDL